MSNYQKTRWPLSGAQSGIWYAQQLDPENPIYNTGECIEFQGALDQNLFAAALRQTIMEAESLHARFGEDQDGPWQIIDPACDWTLDVIDVSGKEHPREAAETWMRADMARPVDLRRGPLFAEALFKLAPDCFLWYQRIHHIAIDGFGFSLIARRVARIYSALVDGLPPDADAFKSFHQILEEEAAYRDSKRFEQDRQFWLDHFADKPNPVSLADRTARTSHSFLRRTAQFPPSGVDRLHAAAQRMQANWSDVVIAAAAAYVYRLTGSRDVILGLPMMGRLGSVSLRIPGMVVNLLPLRLSVHPDMSFSGLVRQVAQEIGEVRRHHGYRHEDLRRDLKLVGDHRRLFGPLINLMPFDYSLNFAGVRASARNLSAGPVDDLSINVYDRSDGSGLRIDFDANPALYTNDDLAAHHRRFLYFLETAVAADPKLPIGRIEILPPEERRRMTAEWKELAYAQPQNHLPELFEAQAARRPEAIAVAFDDVTLSYGELNARANRLAHLLIADGAGPEKIVALALPRSVEMVIGLLAVLKTGAAYLPLDPDYPAERIAYMLADAAPACIITNSQAASKLPDGGGALRIVIDEPGVAGNLRRCPDTNPTDADRINCLLPKHPAYIIYTSGSTGKPKGVVIPHQNVVRLFRATEQWFHFGSDDVWTLFHSYAFDFSVWEIWGPLLHGGRLVVVPYDVSRSPAEFLRLLARERVSVLNQTPSAFYQLMQADREHPDIGQALSLRRVIFGGEALEPGRLEDWYSRHPDTKPLLVNMYGITETTVHVSYMEFDRKIAGRKGSSLIGQAIQDLHVYLLDDYLQPVAPGAVGEMYVAGAGLARGYLGRPDLTAGRFVADPFGPPGTRMYRSGDLARRLGDGSLEYAGRSDHQVKIRGFRIELGEIEAVLVRHPRVAQAAVIVREDQPGDKRLAAYIVPGADGSVDSAELRRHAAGSLPDYMVPSVFVGMAELPLTPNGKLDRKALPAPDFAAAAAGRGPRTPQEEILCDLFTEVLGLPRRISIDEGFFDLGGHSLLAVRLMGRIHEELGIELGIGNLFTSSTVAELAERLNLGDNRSALDVLLPLRAHGERSPLFCVHPAGGLSWCYAGLTRALGPDYPIYGLQARGIAKQEALPKTLEEMAADYVEHIRKVQPSGPYHLLGWSLGGSVAHEVAVQLQNQGEQVPLLVMLDAYPSRYLRLREGLDEREALIALLVLGGYDPDSLGDKPLELANVIELLRRDGSALASLDEDVILDLKAVFENSVSILSDFSPGRFHGDLTFFHSTVVQDWFDPIDPETWLPYIDGRIEQHDVNCQHKDLCQQGPLAEIGRVLAAKLNALNGAAPRR